MIALPVLLAASLFAQPARQVDQIFAKWNRQDSAGCSVGVIRNGKVEFTKGYGVAALSTAVANSAQTSFHLASTTKEFTAASILLLVERAALRLDDPVRKHLPELPEYMQPVTVRHLLQHTSGIRDYVALWTMMRTNAPMDTKAVLELIGRQNELNFEPGTQFLYSNSNYVLLAEIMKRLGFPLPEFAKENIFTPLGLSNTSFQTGRTNVGTKRAGGFAIEEGKYRPVVDSVEVLGDGGVFTTVDDMLRWLLAIEKPEGAFAKVFAAMRTKAKLKSGNEAEYGMGLMIKRYRGLEYWNHPGGAGAYRSDIVYIPSEKFGVVCLCNAADASPGRLVLDVADAYLGPRKPPAVKVDDSDLARKGGMFRDRESGDFMLIVPQDGKLFVQFQTLNLKLEPLTPMKFRTVESDLDLELEFKNAGDNDAPSFLRVESEIHKPMVVDRVEASSSPEPQQFIGDYVADEVPARARIEYFADEGGLNLLQSGVKIGNLIHIAPDKFLVKVLNIEFVRDGAGKVSGFRLNTGRVRHLFFKRLPATP